MDISNAQSYPARFKISLETHEDIYVKYRFILRNG